jgi:PAS domain S-box-containing protein
MQVIESPADRQADGNDQILLSLLRATSAYTGDQFLTALTLNLANLRRLKSTFVCELLLTGDMAREVAGTVNGELAEPLEFSVASTPGAEVVNSGSAVFPSSVLQTFPEDKWLRQIEAESYAAVLLRSSSGDPIGILGIAGDQPIQDADFTLELLQSLAPRVAAELERRQMENALRRSEARMRLLVEHSKDMMFYYQVSPTGGFQYVSPAASEILGLPPEALEANPDLGIELLQDEDRVEVMRAISSGKEEPIIAQIRRPDGEPRWIEYCNFAFRDEESRLVGIAGNIRDITPRFRVQDELKTAQRYTRTLLENLPDTVLRLDSEGTVLDFVPGEALAGLPPAVRVVGRHFRDVLPAEFANLAQRLLRSAGRAGRQQTTELEVELQGDTRFYEVRCVPFREEDTLIIIRDFTAARWHEGEEDRRRLRDELDGKIESRIRSNPYGLTYRELAILHLVAEGAADKQIAESLGISTYTVNKHVGNILGKMSASSRTEAGVRAIREQLLG